VATKPPESLSTSAAFLAYEVTLAAGFIVLFTPYALLKMIRSPRFRAGVGQRLSLRAGDHEAEIGVDPIWIQAVSLGEVKSVAPLVRKINAGGVRPVFLTTTTETGFRVANELLGIGNAIAYFPLDFSPIVRRVLARVKPRAIVLFETEIWPNLIRAASSLQIPISIVNGRISQKSFRFYRLIPGIFRNVFSRISFAGMQSLQDADRAVALGARPETVEVCGNVKFDAAPEPPSPEEIETLRRELMLEKDAPLIVAGSTHEGEERAILEAYPKVLAKQPHARLLLAPRHPDRFDAVEALIRDTGLEVRRRTRPRDEVGTNSRAVVLLDTIGELARVYSLASVTFVGGSLARVGGHNIIEPASMGKPVLFGPHMHHFEDVKEAFLSENAAVRVNDAKELLSVMLSLLENPSAARALGEAARGVVDAHRGATDRYLQALEKYF
jgi:3-deoxy-D-manno-octulosonic-acid transferase